MTTTTLTILLIVAGVLHLCITSAGLVMTIVLNWRSNLQRLDGLTRHVIWTHGSFVMLTIIGFGLVSILCAPILASGDPLGRAVCGFIALFWGIRLILQFALFDARPHLTKFPLKLGFHGLTIVFAYFTFAYGLAAILPRA